MVGAAVRRVCVIVLCVLQTYSVEIGYKVTNYFLIIGRGGD